MNQRVYVADEVNACRVVSASGEIPPPGDIMKGQRVDAEERDAYRRCLVRERCESERVVVWLSSAVRNARSDAGVEGVGGLWCSVRQRSCVNETSMCIAVSSLVATKSMRPPSGRVTSGLVDHPQARAKCRRADLNAVWRSDRRWERAGHTVGWRAEGEVKPQGH